MRPRLGVGGGVGCAGIVHSPRLSALSRRPLATLSTPDSYPSWVPYPASIFAGDITTVFESSDRHFTRSAANKPFKPSAVILEERDHLATHDDAYVIIFHKATRGMK